MPTVQPIRPPPPALLTSPAPDDFDDAMTARWHDWQLRGSAQSVRTKSRATAIFSTAGLAGVVVAVMQFARS